MTGRLAEIKAPTLILLGDRSRIISPDMLRTMRERIQNSRLRMFPNISDGIDLIMPERCAEEALAFITEVE
jgi:pimeloyl-ACP methyl ester carboxylesterase